METIFAIIVCAIAVCYIYLKFRTAAKGGGSACGCGGCTDCPSDNSLDREYSSDESLGKDENPDGNIASISK